MISRGKTLHGTRKWNEEQIIIFPVNSIYSPLFLFTKSIIGFLFDCFSKEFAIDATITSHTMSQINSHTEMKESHRTRTDEEPRVFCSARYSMRHGMVATVRDCNRVTTIYERENCVVDVIVIIRSISIAACFYTSQLVFLFYSTSGDICCPKICKNEASL